MIEPVLSGDAFLSNVHSAPAGELHLWWLGQSGYLVQWQGAHLLIDPYLSDSLTQKYAGTDKPHVRMTGRVIAPERLDFIQVVTSSHNHTDHLDGDTLIPLLKANPGLKIIIPRANLAFAAARLQVAVERLTPICTGSDPIEVGPFRFQAIASAHEKLEQDEHGDPRFIGYLIQVAGRTIYHSGDACLYDDLVERLQNWKIDLAILPINGRDPRRGVPGNFSASEAIRLGKDIRAGLVVPCHYAMFEFNSVSPEEFAAEARTAGIDYRILRCGERLTLPASR